MMNKLWKCLLESKVVYIGLLKSANTPQLIVEVVEGVDIVLKIPATQPQLIEDFMDVCQV